MSIYLVDDDKLMHQIGASGQSRSIGGGYENDIFRIT